MSEAMGHWWRAAVPAALAPSPWSTKGASRTFFIGRRTSEEGMLLSLGLEVGDEVPEGRCGVVVPD